MIPSRAFLLKAYFSRLECGCFCMPMFTGETQGDLCRFLDSALSDLDSPHTALSSITPSRIEDRSQQRPDKDLFKTGSKRSFVVFT